MSPLPWTARLRGFDAPPQARELRADGNIDLVEAAQPRPDALETTAASDDGKGKTQSKAAKAKLYPFSISRGKLEQANFNTGLPVEIVDDVSKADALMTLRHAYRKKPPAVREAENRSIPIYVIKSNTLYQMEQVLLQLGPETRAGGSEADVFRDTEDAIAEIMSNGRSKELAPANAYIRKLQHEIANRYNLETVSSGREPKRRVRIIAPSSPHESGY